MFDGTGARESDTRGSEIAGVLLLGRSVRRRRLSRGVGDRGRERLGCRPAADRRGSGAFVPGSSQPEGEHAAATALPAREPPAVPGAIAASRRRRTPREHESESRHHEADALHSMDRIPQRRATPSRRHRGCPDGSAPRPIAAWTPPGDCDTSPIWRRTARGVWKPKFAAPAAIPGTSRARCRGRPRPRRPSLPPGRP